MWKCDQCGNDINTVDEGYIEWIVDAESSPRKAYGLRLVHSKIICRHNKHQKQGHLVADLPLEQYSGSKGLIRLLSLIAEGELPKEDVLEIIKRLHVAGYETARFYLEEAEGRGIIERNTVEGYPHLYQIERVNQAIKSGDLD